MHNESLLRPETPPHSSGEDASEHASENGSVHTLEWEMEDESKSKSESESDGHNANVHLDFAGPDVNFSTS